MSSIPTTLIVHGPAGSAPPVLARALADAAAELGLTPWSLVDRGGDPGIDAMTALFERAGDPGVISTCTPVFLQAPLLRALGPRHRQLTPIARLVSDRFFVVVRADSPFAEASAFLDHIRSTPTRSGGYFLGGINHLLALAIAEATGAKVDFKVVASEPAVWDDLKRGDIDWGCGVAAEILPHVASGHLKPIAVLGEARREAFPDIPTLAEAGVPVTFRLWRGLLAPPGIGTEAQSRRVGEVERLRGTKAWGQYLAANGQHDDSLGGAAFGAFLDEEWDWYQRHLGAAGLLPVAA